MLDLSAKTGNLRDLRHRSDVLPALCRQQLGRSARSLSRRRHADRPGLVRLRRHHSRPGATPPRSTASPTACRTTAKSRSRSIARTSTTQKGLKPAETLDEFAANAAAIHDPPTGCGARRCAASPAPARTCTSIRRSSARSAANGSSERQADGEHARGAWRRSTGTSTLNATTRRPAVENWNWPDIADAFSQGTSASYIDAHSSAGGAEQSRRSRKSIGKIGFARWPKGPRASACTSIWNWGFPINAALSDEAEEGDVAVHPVGDVEGDRRRAPSWQFAGPGEALRRQSHVALARARIRRS